MLSVLMAVLLGQVTVPTPAASPAPVPDVRRLTVAIPHVLAEIDTDKVQGVPVGLAWRADGVIYLRVTQGKDKTRHFQIATVPSPSVGQSDQAPVWAANYWNWKSAIVAPGDTTLKIDVEQRAETLRSVNTSSASGLAGMSSGTLVGAGGGEGVSQGVVAMAAQNMQKANVVTMRFKGQLVGEWTNEAPQPGIRYGWAPAPMGLLAYVDAESRLALVDRDGHKVLVPGAANVTLPAWSMDGTEIVFLQKKSGTLYLLMVAPVR